MMTTRLRRLILLLMMLLLPLQAAVAVVMPWCDTGPAQAADQHASQHAAHHQTAGDEATNGADATCYHCAWCLGGVASVPPASPVRGLAAVAAPDPLPPGAGAYAAPTDQPYRPPLSTFA